MAKERRSGLLSSIDTNAGLATKAYEADVGQPTQYDNDAQMFSEFGKMFSAPNDRPRGIARNIGAGFATGLAAGSRSSAIEERQQKLGKYQKQMDYLKAAGDAAMKQNQWYADQEHKLETIKPFAIGGLEVSYSGMDYATGNDRMRNIMDQAKLADPSIKGDYVGYVPNSPIVNMRDPDGNITAFSLSSIVGEDVVKRVQENYINQQKINTEKEFAPVKYGVMQERIDETRRRNDQGASKHDMKLSETLGKKIDASKEFLTIVPKMEEIVTKHPDIFQSAIDAMWRESREPGYASAFVKSMQDKWNPEKVAALTSMVKYINKMTLDVANGFARPNMFIEKIGSKAVPNLDMNPQGFLKVLGEMKQENEMSLKNNLQRFDLLKSDMGAGLSEQYRESARDVLGDASGSDDFSDLGRLAQ